MSPSAVTIACGVCGVNAALDGRLRASAARDLDEDEASDGLKASHHRIIHGR